MSCSGLSRSPPLHSICTSISISTPACLSPDRSRQNPGVRPIGVCEVPRRILSKAILFVLKGDIQEAAGSNQLCGGQVAGIEAAVHSVRQLFDDENSEARLLVDASNAFQ